MSAGLEAALGELGRHFPGLQEVVRVDVDDDGVLTLTAVGGGGTRWFTHVGTVLSERLPARDAKLPLAARLEASGDWSVLSYRPGRRIVVLVRGERVEVLKGHKKARSARAAVRQGLAESAMRRGGFQVPRLLRHEREHEALVFEYLAGPEVELGAAQAPLYARLGERLGVFQLAEDALELEVFGPTDELAVLARWEGKVLRVADLPSGWAESRARLAQRVPLLPVPRLGLCHRDLHDRQVHLTGADVALLDFDLLCRADVALDPGNLVAHLRWRGLQGVHGADVSSVRALENAFLSALGRQREPGFEARLAFYTASALLRLALVYRLRPRWSARVGKLVALARAVLDDLAPTP